MNANRKKFSHFYMFICFLLINYSATADEAYKKGERIFKQNCVFCHQADAIGKAGFAPSLTNPELLSIASDEFLISTIRDGRIGTAMPPYAHLSVDDIKAIVFYLREHTKAPNRSEEVDNQRIAQGDPRQGELWFEMICSTCHGTKGEGYLAGGSGTAIGNPGFLDKASDGFIRETIMNGRSNTRMLPFSGPDALANLSAQEIDDIISYMRTLN